MAQIDKESACNTGDLGSTPGLGRSSEGGHDNPFQYSCLENPHGQRSLVGHRVTESDMTEQLSTAYKQHTKHTGLFLSINVLMLTRLFSNLFAHLKLSFRSFYISVHRLLCFILFVLMGWR